MYNKHTLHNIISLTDATVHTLQTYVDLIGKWQRAVNLVSKHSLKHIWHRHIADSIQIYPLIPTACKTLADLGSGGGLPAIVIAILAQDTDIGQDIHITMIESDKKKALFLRHCIRELHLNASVINDRIENIQDTHFHIVTARALCEVRSLLDFMTHLQCPQGIFLKGESVAQEIANAKTQYTFGIRQTQSLTHSESSILSIAL